MTDTFKAVTGRRVVSRASAEPVGTVARVVLALDRENGPTVSAVVIGKGKKASLVRWADLTGVGPDAVIVGDEANLVSPETDHDRAAVDGRLELLGKRALLDTGHGVGTVADAIFDPDTGKVLTILVGGDSGREVPATALLGLGSYAAVLDAGAVGESR
jgi:sporulation protein YlmC with PRC-barrel domain